MGFGIACYYCANQGCGGMQIGRAVGGKYSLCPITMHFFAFEGVVETSYFYSSRALALWPFGSLIDTPDLVIK